MKKNTIVTALSTLLLTMILTTSISARELVYNATGLITDGIGADFTLKGPNGNPVTLSDYQGKIVMLYFGYTSCPDICPTSLSIMQRTMKALGEDAKEVQGIFVTVDPSRDGGEKLQTFVKYFHPTFIGVEGSDEEIKKSAKPWNVAYKVEASESEAGYLISHSDYIYVLDRQGELAALFNSTSRSDDMTTAIQKLIKEEPPSFLKRIFGL